MDRQIVAVVLTLQNLTLPRFLPLHFNVAQNTEADGLVNMLLVAIRDCVAPKQEEEAVRGF
jgi:hypothetical protein